MVKEIEKEQEKSEMELRYEGMYNYLLNRHKKRCENEKLAEYLTQLDIDRHYIRAKRQPGGVPRNYRLLWGLGEVLLAKTGCYVLKVSSREAMKYEELYIEKRASKVMKQRAYLKVTRQKKGAEEEITNIDEAIRKDIGIEENEVVERNQIIRGISEWLGDEEVIKSDASNLVKEQAILYYIDCMESRVCRDENLTSEGLLYIDETAMRDQLKEKGTTIDEGNLISLIEEIYGREVKERVESEIKEVMEEYRDELKEGKSRPNERVEGILEYPGMEESEINIRHVAGNYIITKTIKEMVLKVIMTRVSEEVDEREKESQELIRLEKEGKQQKRKIREKEKELDKITNILKQREKEIEVYKQKVEEGEITGKIKKEKEAVELELREKDKEIERLEEEVQKERNRLCGANSRVETLEERLKRYEELEKDLMAIQMDNMALKSEMEQVLEDMESIEDEDEREYEARRARIADKRVLFIGGRGTGVEERLRKDIPLLDYIEGDGGVNFRIGNGYDIVIIYTKYISHSHVYRVKKEVGEGTPVACINVRNNKLVLREIDRLLNK